MEYTRKDLKRIVSLADSHQQIRFKDIRKLFPNQPDRYFYGLITHPYITGDLTIPFVRELREHNAILEWVKQPDNYVVMFWKNFMTSIVRNVSLILL